MNVYDGSVTGLTKAIVSRIDKLEIEAIPLLKGELDGATIAARALFAQNERRMDRLAESIGKLTGELIAARAQIDVLDKRISVLAILQKDAEAEPPAKTGLFDKVELAERNRLAAELEQRAALPVTLHNWNCVIDWLADISPAFRRTLS